LPEDKTWETDSCMNKNGCGSISRYDQSPNQRLEIGCLGSQSMILVILTILWLTYSQNPSVAIISLMNNQPMSSVVLLILLILIRPLVPICYDLSP